MYIKTVKLKKPVAVMLIVVFIAALVLLVGVCTVKAADHTRIYKIATEQQRQAVISELGWQTSEKPSEHKSITIPEEFDDVYKGYNELQKAQGFDLEAFKGSKAEVYVYPVYNYKGHKDNMQLTMISVDGKLIAGDICCTELDGFMQGLAPEKS